MCRALGQGEDLEFAQAHDGALAEMEPAGRGQEGGQGAGAVGQVEGADDALQLDLPMLGTGVADQVEAASLPGGVVPRPGRFQPGGSVRPERVGVGADERLDAPEGGHDEVGRTRFLDEPATLEDAQRGREIEPATDVGNAGRPRERGQGEPGLRSRGA